MRGGTLFSGIGAPEASAPWINWRWSADIDEFANAVRAHHWPEVPNLGDVAAIRDAERVDLIVFGSPCQSFSVAGKRLGLEDPRGNLALVALALVARLRPTWIVFENVPGLLSSDDGRDFGIFLRTVEECGYLGCWRVLDAQYAGVPQRRRRVFFVGYLGDWRPPAAVLFEPESLRWNPPPRREARQGSAPATPLGVALRGRDGGGTAELTGETQPALHCAGGGGDKPHVLAFGGNDTRGPIDVATAVNAHGGPCGRMDFGSETFVTFSCKDHAADAGEVSPTLRSMGPDGSHANGGGQVAVAWALGSHAGAADGEQANASHASGGPVGLGVQEECAYSLRGGRTQAVAAPFGPMVRRLTPRECERLQGFPDDFTLIPWRGGQAPDGRRYRALGNSMAVPVIGWILDRIHRFEAAERAVA